MQCIMCKHYDMNNNYCYKLKADKYTFDTCSSFNISEDMKQLIAKLYSSDTIKELNEYNVALLVEDILFNFKRNYNKTFCVCALNESFIDVIDIVKIMNIYSVYINIDIDFVELVLQELYKKYYIFMLNEHALILFAKPGEEVIENEKE